MSDDLESHYGGLIGLGARAAAQNKNAYLGTQSELSLKRRIIPKHPKGFNNEWGAIM